MWPLLIHEFPGIIPVLPSRRPPWSCSVSRHRSQFVPSPLEFLGIFPGFSGSSGSKFWDKNLGGSQITLGLQGWGSFLAGAVKDLGISGNAGSSWNNGNNKLDWAAPIFWDNSFARYSQIQVRIHPKSHGAIPAFIPPFPELPEIPNPAGKTGHSLSS